MISRVLAGDVNAFEHLVRRYQYLVLALVKRHIPADSMEDTIQDIYVRAYRSLPTFKKSDSFRHWLSVISVRTCYDFWRKYYKSRELPMSRLTEEQQAWIEATLADQSDGSSYEKYLQKDAAEILNLALDRLSAGDRMVMELVYLEGHSVKEAAGLLGWSTANVKVRLFRTRKKLRALLDHTR
ncbi:MAG: RNA polymerase sigma factor [Syntrophorhabdales bacterium]